MKNIPDRNDEKYLEIERFHDFEFTECVAWEMAIRNDNVKFLLLEMVEIRKNIFFNYAYSTQRNKIASINELNNDSGEPVDILKYLRDEKIFLEVEKKKIVDLEKNAKLNNSTGMYLIDELVELKNLMNDFEKKYQETPEPFSPINTTKTLLLSNKELPELIDMANNFYSNYETLKNEYFILFEDYVFCEEQLGKIIGNTQTVSWKMDYKKWNQYKITTKSNQEIDSSLFPERSRSTLIVPSEISNSLLLNINLNLPLHEIYSYIGQLQQVYMQDRKLILPGIVNSKRKSKLLLNIPKQEIVYGKNKKAKLKNVFSSRRTIATMFYVYDCIKKGIIFTDIQSELSLYNDKNSDIVKTLTPYYEIAKHYIDDEHYKELLTGYAIA